MVLVVFIFVFDDDLVWNFDYCCIFWYCFGNYGIRVYFGISIYFEGFEDFCVGVNDYVIIDSGMMFIFILVGFV